MESKLSNELTDILQRMASEIRGLRNEVDYLKRLEYGGSAGVTDHGALTGLGDNDHPQYLLTTAKAADSDKLDGLDSSGFAPASHTHDGVYIPLTNFAGSNATVTGWSGTPAKQITYVVIGKLLLISIYVSGTSNSTSTRVYLPTGITGATHGVTQWAGCRITNNGVTSATSGMAGLPNGGAYIDFYSTWSGATWIATGAKMVSGNFAWIIN